jgi:hypothetical protein
MHSFFQLLLLSLCLYEWQELENLFGLVNGIEHEEKLTIWSRRDGENKIAQIDQK